MMKRFLIFALVVCMAATLFGCTQSENTAESMAKTTATATDATTRATKARPSYYDLYPTEIADILADSNLSHAEQDNAIGDLVTQRQAECEELKVKIEDSARALFKKYQEKDAEIGGSSLSMFSDERLQADLEQFEAYYDDMVAMIEEKTEVYKRAHVWMYVTGNWQGTDCLIHTYEFWTEFREELAHLSECSGYKPETSESATE